MECRTFEIILVSASNLLDVRFFSSMKVYAHVTVRGSGTTKTTEVDMNGKTNPYWNCKFTYNLNESTIHQDGVIDIILYCHRSFDDDKYVGEVNLTLKSMFDGKLSGTEGVTYSVVRRDLTGTFGTIDVSYVFGEIYMAEVGFAKDAGTKSTENNFLNAGVSLVNTVCNVLTYLGSA